MLVAWRKLFAPVAVVLSAFIGIRRNKDAVSDQSMRLAHIVVVAVICVVLVVMGLIGIVRVVVAK
jgi:hypothetical protein